MLSLPNVKRWRACQMNMFQGVILTASEESFTYTFPVNREDLYAKCHLFWYKITRHNMIVEDISLYFLIRPL